MTDRQLRDAVDMLDLVATKVALQPIGDAISFGLCPFHDEIEPSFIVDQEMGIFHCFECGRTGDCFDWLWVMEGMRRDLARMWLAERYRA